MFINTEDRGIINASLCRRIIKKRGEPGIYTFIFSDDEWIDAQPCSADHIENLCHNEPIAAAPGFFHLKYHGYENEGWFDSSPIIAWHGEFEYGAVPITIEGAHVWGGDANGRLRAIRFPDGRVFDQYSDLLFETENEWVESIINAEKERASA